LVNTNQVLYTQIDTATAKLIATVANLSDTLI
jgi:hypothetical protein